MIARFPLCSNSVHGSRDHTGPPVSGRPAFPFHSPKKGRTVCSSEKTKRRSIQGQWNFSSPGSETPGKTYEGTRHNAGFAALEALAEKLDVRVDRVRFQSFCGEGRIGDRKVLLMMPQTFMNLSGEAVRDAMQFYKLPPERCLILFDDISLPVGVIRVRRKGSDGGQKGMRSIITLTGQRPVSPH